MISLRRLALSIAACAALAGVPCAKAEVRLQRARGAVAVTITTTTAGPWSLVGRLDGRVLNPDGDRLRHGQPSWLSVSDAVLVAWRSNVGVELALGAERWTRLETILTDAPIDDVIVVPLGDGWSVLWRTPEAPSALQLVDVTREGRLSPVIALGAARLDRIDAVGPDGLVAATVCRPGAPCETLDPKLVVPPADPFPLPWGRTVRLADRLLATTVSGTSGASTTVILLGAAPPADPILIPGVHLPGGVDPTTTRFLIPALTVPIVAGTTTPVPEVHPVPLGYALTWQEGATPSIIRAKTVSSDGRLSDPIDLTDGQLVGSVSAGGDGSHASVITLQRDGVLSVIDVAFPVSANPDALALPVVGTPTQLDVVPSLGVADIQVHRDELPTVLTWWAGPRELRFVAMGDQGAILPIRSITTKGGGVHPQLLIKRALTEIRGH